MPSTNTGSNPDFKSKMPGTTDVASIQDAIRYLLYGGTDSASAIVNSNAAGGTLVNTDASHGLVGQLNAMKTSLTNSAIQKAYLTAKGQLITATSSGVPALLSPGTDPSVGNDFVLRANSAAASGLDWVNISTSYLPKTAGASHPLTGSLTINGSGDTYTTISSPNTNRNGIVLQDSGSSRWAIGKDTTGNGTNLYFDKYNGGTALTGVGTTTPSPLSIDYATAQTKMTHNMQKASVTGSPVIADGDTVPSGSMRMMDGTSGVQTVTVSNNSFPAGTYWNFYHNALGSTGVTFTAGANVVIQSAGGMNKLRTTYSVATLLKHSDGATDYWMLFGDLKS